MTLLESEARGVNLPGEGKRDKAIGLYGGDDMVELWSEPVSQGDRIAGTQGIMASIRREHARPSLLRWRGGLKLPGRSR